MFSDYFAKKLVTPTTTLDLSWAPTESDPPGVTVRPGTSIKVFGPTSAQLVEGDMAYKTFGTTRSAHDLLDMDDAEAAPLDYVIGTDPFDGDPDSPEPPMMIVTRFPRLNGFYNIADEYGYCWLFNYTAPSDVEGPVDITAFFSVYDPWAKERRERRLVFHVAPK
jgi:hypothetical protein